MATAMHIKKKFTSNSQPSASEKEKQNIKVVARIRPMTKLEEKMQIRPIIKCASSKEVMTRDKKFTFDRAFHAEVDQLEVYLSVVAPMIPDVVAGYNCTVFAYGQTGSGKTYTMTGDNCQCPSNWKEDLNAGCIPRAAAHIFDELQREKNETNVKVSYLELYNEEIRDLLSEDDSLLAIYNDTKGSVFIQGLKEISVHDGEQLCKELQKGNLKRQTAPTLMNHQSSRSHTVLTITVYTRENTISGEDILKTGKLNLVDLAGSENIARSGCKDMRAIELANINKSLLTLGRVIQALADKSQKHVPYRDSKLTRILKDSLGGNTKTCIIATVSPAAAAYEETVSTLEYASRARDIKNTPTINEKLTKAQMVQSLLSEIDKLQKDLDAARNKSGFFIDKDNYQRLLDTVELVTGEKLTMKELTRKQTLRIKELEEIMQSKTKEFDDAVDMCKRSKELLAKAEETIKEKGAKLKQEQFVAQVYETEASQLHKQAEVLLSTTKQLSVERGILQEKLHKQYNINITNQTTGESAVSRVLQILHEMSDEGEKLRLSDENIRKLCKDDIDNLKLEIQRPLEEVVKLLDFFNMHNLNELAITDELRNSTNRFITTIKEKTIEFQSMLTCHFENLTLETFMKDFKLISHKYIYAVYDLAESIHETLATKNENIFKNIVQLEEDIMARIRREVLLHAQRMDVDEKILHQVRVIKEHFRARNYKERGQQLLSEMVEETKKSEERAVALMDNLSKTIRNELYNTDLQVSSDKVLTALEQFAAEANVLTTRFNENQEQLQLAQQSVTTRTAEVSDILETRINTLHSRFEYLMIDSSTFQTMFDAFVERTRHILKEDVVEKFVPVKHEGDTPPARGSVVVAKSVQPLAPRAVLIERFKKQRALFGDESASGSDLDLEDPSEPADSTPS